MKAFYTSGALENALPVPGAEEGIHQLRTLGFRLVIVTSRSQSSKTQAWSWVQRWFPDCFDEIICVGSLAGDDGSLGKAEACMMVGAKLLIDDSLDNALACVRYVPAAGLGMPPPVLLFGTYEWNRRLSQPNDAQEDMVFDVRLARDGGQQFLEEDARRAEEVVSSVNTSHPFVHRVRDWDEVVRYVAEARKEGRP